MTEITDEDIKAEAIANLNSRINRINERKRHNSIERHNLQKELNELVERLTEVGGK